MSCPADPVRAEVLRSAPLHVLGRFATASNATLLVQLGDDAVELPIDGDGALAFDRVDADRLAVHKPRAGEAPLWDFPPGTLYLREVAAYEVSAALGWDLVPVTVERGDGPYGVGAVQQFVAHDPERHYFALVEEGRPELLAQLRRMVAFDLVVNNTDRKAGHVLVDAGERIWLVDHGVTFHEHDKLRTVAWEFAGEPVPEDLAAEVGALAERLQAPDSPVRRRLCQLLAEPEVLALLDRAREVATFGRFPEPRGPRPYPWPLL